MNKFIPLIALGAVGLVALVARRSKEPSDPFVPGAHVAFNAGADVLTGTVAKRDGDAVEVILDVTGERRRMAVANVALA